MTPSTLLRRPTPPAPRAAPPEPKMWLSCPHFGHPLRSNRDRFRSRSTLHRRRALRLLLWPVSSLLILLLSLLMLAWLL